MKAILDRLPPDIDWRVWCLATSEKIPDGLVTIQADWTVLDVMQGIDVLAALGEIEAALAPDLSIPRR